MQHFYKSSMTFLCWPRITSVVILQFVRADENWHYGLFCWYFLQSSLHTRSVWVIVPEIDQTTHEMLVSPSRYYCCSIGGNCKSRMHNVVLKVIAFLQTATPHCLQWFCFWKAHVKMSWHASRAHAEPPSSPFLLFSFPLFFPFSFFLFLCHFYCVSPACFKNQHRLM